MQIADKPLAYALLRVALGVNFFGHGAIRVFSGVPAFAAATAAHMAKSPLPAGAILAFAYVIPVVELLLGTVLILGWLTRPALVAGAVFMLALTMGVTANQQWEVASEQLIYSGIFFVLLFLRGHNHLSLDGWWRRRQGAFR